MPEYPEISLYLHVLSERLVGKTLEGLRIRSPSLLKSFDPPVSAVVGKRILGFERIGKRVVFVLEDDLFVVVHLMISGRFKWTKAGTAVPKKRGHAAFDVDDGTLLLTEASTHKRASLYVVRGREGLEAHNPGGIDPLSASLEAFSEAMLSENRTLKRALTDPRILDGIGNAHSDEILLRARLSPVKRTRQLSDEEMERLLGAIQECLPEWAERLIEETGDRFPTKVTAFHPKMAAHGKFGEPCPQCGSPIQRIVYASRETNYCPECQTGGRLLADRALSRILREDWPKTAEELELMKRGDAGAS